MGTLELDWIMPEWHLMVDVCGDEVEPLGYVGAWIACLSDYVCG